MEAPTTDTHGQGERRLSAGVEREQTAMLVQVEQPDAAPQHHLNASYLRAAAGNPLLNDSINRSQLSEAAFVSALSPETVEPTPQELAGQRGQRAPVGAQGGQEANHRERLNQRYQEECDEMMVVNEG